MTAKITEYNFCNLIRLKLTFSPNQHLLCSLSSSIQSAVSGLCTESDNTEISRPELLVSGLKLLTDS